MYIWRPPLNFIERASKYILYIHCFIWTLNTRLATLTGILVSRSREAGRFVHHACCVFNCLRQEQLLYLLSINGCWPVTGGRWLVAGDWWVVPCWPDPTTSEAGSVIKMGCRLWNYRNWGEMPLNLQKVSSQIDHSSTPLSLPHVDARSEMRPSGTLKLFVFLRLCI